MLVSIVSFSFFSILNSHIEKGVGHHARLPEIQQCLAENDSLKNLSKNREQELLDALIEHRKMKDTGAQVSNKSASLDYQGTLKGIFTEVCFPLLQYIEGSLTWGTSSITSQSVQDPRHSHSSPAATSMTAQLPHL